MRRSTDDEQGVVQVCQELAHEQHLHAFCSDWEVNMGASWRTLRACAGLNSRGSHLMYTQCGVVGIHRKPRRAGADISHACTAPLLA